MAFFIKNDKKCSSFLHLDNCANWHPINFKLYFSTSLCQQHLGPNFPWLKKVKTACPPFFFFIQTKFLLFLGVLLVHSFNFLAISCGLKMTKSVKYHHSSSTEQLTGWHRKSPSTTNYSFAAYFLSLARRFSLELEPLLHKRY